MITKLPHSIATYIQATNARDTDTLLTIFTPDAVVTDEGHKYHGLDEIKEWKNRSHEKYQYSLEVINVAEGDNETVVTNLVSGNFDGSPVQLHFHFTLKGDKIAELSILE
jgi:uncharacterized protein (TIGR02246 family)